VISGLRKLAVFANQPEKAQFKATMAKFAPNYMKTLLELYRTKVRFTSILLKELPWLKEFA